MTDEFGPDIVVDNLDSVEAVAVIDCLYRYGETHESFQHMRERISSAMLSNPSAWDFTKVEHARLCDTVRWALVEQRNGNKVTRFSEEMLETCEKKLWDAYRRCA